jgi:hypothetical protein
MAKNKETVVRLTLTPQVELGLKNMYPSVRSGMVSAINAWPELMFSSIQEIAGVFTEDVLSLMAENMSDKDYDPISMLDGSLIIKNLEVYARYREIPHFDDIKDAINKMSAAQRFALADWCYRYNKMPKKQEEMLQSFAKKEKQK